MSSEDDFVEELVELTGGTESYIGDDCAVLEQDDVSLLATVDSLVESVHFPPDATVSQIARKLTRVNLSDIAAMGGNPLWALLSEGSNLTQRERSDFTGYLVEELRSFSVILVGGDIASVPEDSGTFCSLTILGEPSGETVLRRSNAEPGDLIAVSGDLGGPSAALSKGNKDLSDRDLELLYSPPVNLSLGQELIRSGFSCAIDISDGLVKDLNRVCRASGRGAKLRWEDVPVDKHARQRASGQEELLRWVLGGGEEFELLVAVPPELGDRLPDDFTVIGNFTKSETIQFEPALPDGLKPETLGYDHLS